MGTLNDLANECQVLIDRDNQFQRRARIMQALWRKDKDYPAAERDDGPLGSSIPLVLGESERVNFLDDGIRQVVAYVLAQHVSEDERVIRRDRLFANLLSSQPMAFNLFAHLKRDVELDTKCFRRLSNNRVLRVTNVEFEYSDGRGDETYTGDHSAFDVFIAFDTPSGQHGFIGIEVKYHEDLRDKKVYWHERYPIVARRMKCFDMKRLEVFKKGPLHQIWRDHLLAGAHRWHEQRGYADGFFVFLSPKDNDACNRAVAEYRSHLVDSSTFEHWTLERVVEAIQQFTNEPWIEAFHDRYLNFAKIDRLLV